MNSASPARAAFVLLVALLAACGSVDTPTAGSADGAVTSTAAPDASATPSTTVEAAAGDLPVAPDFTLSLEPEGEFVLSEAGKPVYLVFWAEW